MVGDKRNRVNDEIDSPEIRLISEDGKQLGVMSPQAALEVAEQDGIDLVEISPLAKPPVCRLMDYGKFLFQQNKKKQAARKNQQQVQIKEIKIRPGTEEADYQTKLKKLKSFLEHGDKAKISLWFRGREMRHQEIGMQLLTRMEADLIELGKVEQMPKLEGRRVSMVIAPRK